MTSAAKPMQLRAMVLRRGGVGRGRTPARCPGPSRTSARRGLRCRARASTSRCPPARAARATSSITRRDSASLSEAIVRVSGSAPTPCASRFPVRRRISSAARFRVRQQGRRVQPFDHLPHRYPLQGEEVALVDRSERAPAVDDDDLPHRALGHHVHGFVRGRRAWQRHDGRGHDLRAPECRAAARAGRRGEGDRPA